MTKRLKIAIVAGEESGDLLGADLVKSIRARGIEVELIGVGGRHLQELGLRSLFDSTDLALMGISAIVRDLPRMIGRISSTAKAIIDAEPDCLITIDTPEFSLRVARKVRQTLQRLPTVHYVCPSVWAWRPGRAAEMQPYIDAILCLLPFEPGALKRLGGPDGVYVGHRLTRDPGVQLAANLQSGPRSIDPNRTKTLVMLPGSRWGEVSRLTDPFGEVVETLKGRGHTLRLVVPTVPHIAETVRAQTAGWPVRPEITEMPDAKWRAFGEADAAIAASGTVALELALSGTPFLSCYKQDPIAQRLRFLVKVWSASLPNLIADKPIVLEYIDEMLRPQHIARMVETLFDDADYRAFQKAGFEKVRQTMATERPAGELAADAVLATIQKVPR